MNVERMEGNIFLSCKRGTQPIDDYQLAFQVFLLQVSLYNDRCRLMG